MVTRGECLKRYLRYLPEVEGWKSTEKCWMDHVMQSQDDGFEVKGYIPFSSQTLDHAVDSICGDTHHTREHDRNHT